MSGLSFHTYSDLMIHPWGWTTSPVADIGLFKTWSDELTRDNAYVSGDAPSILYAVNGEFNDWCYGDSTKPKMYSWTPEIGHDVDGFWPPPSRMAPLAQGEPARLLRRRRDRRTVGAAGRVVDRRGVISTPGTARASGCAPVSSAPAGSRVRI